LVRDARLPILALHNRGRDLLEHDISPLRYASPDGGQRQSGLVGPIIGPHSQLQLGGDTVQLMEHIVQTTASLPRRLPFHSILPL
jgi:hypothetical protein